MKKILLVCNDSDNVINFRSELIDDLLSNGFKVGVIMSDGVRAEEVRRKGADCFVAEYRNRSINPLQALKIKRQFGRIIDIFAPDVVFTFQIKPNLFGVKAAKKSGVKNVFSMVEGLGDPFSGDTTRNKIIRRVVIFLYKKACKNIKKMFFLNHDDANEFIARKIIEKEKCFVIPGIGIDNDKYTVKALPKSNNVVALSRLIVNKGIFDYCEVAKKVREKRKDINFFLYGNESQIRKENIQKYIDDGDVIYGGYTKNAAEKISNSKILVSCSFYREGFPRTILEAMALGRVVVATNCVGNRDAVEDGVTGFLLNPHDIAAFSNIILNIIDDNSRLTNMGLKAKSICEERYDSKIINKAIIDEINEADNE